MCGRFTLTKKIKEIADLFNIEDVSIDIEPSYNIYPGQGILVLLEDKKKYLDIFRWGLIPNWAKDDGTEYNMINARGETLHEKPSFRNLIKNRRCIVLADGFYEWYKRGNKKVPVYIRLKSKEMFCFGALWDIWFPSSEKEGIKSCSIVTTASGDFLKDIHHRMPVILSPENVDEWLDNKVFDRESLYSLFKPYSEDKMEYYEVSLYVNKPENNSSECIRPVNLF